MAKKKVKIFRELRDSLQDALTYEQGAAVNLRVSEIPAAPKRLHRGRFGRSAKRSNASQTIFAVYLNVSPNAVRSWEQGTRRRNMQP